MEIKMCLTSIIVDVEEGYVAINFIQSTHHPLHRQVGCDIAENSAGVTLGSMWTWGNFERGAMPDFGTKLGSHLEACGYGAILKEEQARLGYSAGVTF